MWNGTRVTQPFALDPINSFSLSLIFFIPTSAPVPTDQPTNQPAGLHFIPSLHILQMVRITRPTMHFRRVLACEVRGNQMCVCATRTVGSECNDAPRCEGHVRLIHPSRGAVSSLQYARCSAVQADNRTGPGSPLLPPFMQARDATDGLNRYRMAPLPGASPVGLQCSSADR